MVADTKLDLTVNPLGFLDRASHLWSSQSPLGQVQNQAYGYFFPQGAFFTVTDWLSLPPWAAQRIWWALLITAGFWGVIRVTEALAIGSRASRVIAALAFALSPRVLTTVGSISSETAPMMLAPWVLLPVILALTPPADGRVGNRSLRQYAAASAVAVALMGSVNAVATAGGCLVAGLWWISHRPSRRWWRFTAWWIPCVLLAVAWWVVPLLLLGAVSPPFLDYIESAGVTTQWTALAEVLRGTDSWTPFVSPERIAGAVLVMQPASVIATGLVAAAGIAGLAMRSMPARGRLTLILFVGLVGLGAGYAGELGGPFAESVRAFLDSAGAPLRNVHKLEPLIRLPLAIGLAHLLTHAPLPLAVPRNRWRAAFAHPERNLLVPLATMVLVALTLATSLAWTGKLAPRGAYWGIPDYWAQTAQWLEANTEGNERALLAPGTPFGTQIWGLTRDEAFQPYASTPWAVRDAVPLNPPGAIRALDSVQRLFADGRPSDGLAQTLLAQGIRYVVVRNDLDPETSRSTHPLLVRQALAGSPGVRLVEQIGGFVGPELDEFVADWDLRPQLPAIQIYRVDDPAGITASGPYVVDLEAMPVVQGGPEALLHLAERGRAPYPALLEVDAPNTSAPVIVTDSPGNREADFGRVDHNVSALRSEDDARRTYNVKADYDIGAPLTSREWSGARLSVSSSAADANQLGAVFPGSSAAAAVDGDTSTAWLSNSFQTAVGQWMRVDFEQPIDSAVLRMQTSGAAAGAPVSAIEVETEAGTTTAYVGLPGAEISVPLPLGQTDWITLTAKSTISGPGRQFGIAELIVEANGQQVPISSQVVLPPAPQTVRSWELGQEFPGRAACVTTVDGEARCSPEITVPPEEPGVFTRVIDVPTDTVVAPQVLLRARQGAGLNELLSPQDRVRAAGPTAIGDTRGNTLAVADGDLLTSWTAPADAQRGLGMGPKLTLLLPERTRVTGIRLDPSQGLLPAAPTRVAVNLGAGQNYLEVDNSGTVQPVEAAETERVDIILLDWDEVETQNSLGFTTSMPPGLAEVTLYTDDGPVQATAERTVEVGCDDGPTVSIDGTEVRLSIDAPEALVRSGAAFEATVCNEEPLPLAAGSREVSVDPGPAFMVDGLSLLTPAEFAAAAPTAAPVEVRVWDRAVRQVVVPASGTSQVLVVPESVNTAWQARDTSGRELEPVTVNGWQQGWIVPAGVSGPVDLTFAVDRWYRLSIFGGLALLLPLLALAVFGRGRRSTAPTATTWRSPWTAGGALVVAVFLISGVPGALVALTAGAGFAWAYRRDAKRATAALPFLAGGGALACALALSRGPWRDPGGYLGNTWQVQLLALLGLVALGLSVVVDAARRRSQASSARRDGSSTSA